MDRNTLFSNDFKSVELCKQMQKKCNIENQSDFKLANEIDYYDEIDDENYSIDENDSEQKNDSNASSRLSINNYFKYDAQPLSELNPFLVKNKQHTDYNHLDTPLTPTGILFSFLSFLNLSSFCYFNSKFKTFKKRNGSQFPPLLTPILFFPII